MEQSLTGLVDMLGHKCHVAVLCGLFVFSWHTLSWHQGLGLSSEKYVKSITSGGGMAARFKTLVLNFSSSSAACHVIAWHTLNSRVCNKKNNIVINCSSPSCHTKCQYWSVSDLCWSASHVPEQFIYLFTHNLHWQTCNVLYIVCSHWLYYMLYSIEVWGNNYKTVSIKLPFATN